MAKSNFFSRVRYLNTLAESQALKPDSLAVFDKLVKFLEDAPFSDSGSIQFVSRNWELETGKIYDLWKLQIGEISMANVRYHVWRASSLLFSLFPKFTTDVFVLCQRDVLVDISTVIDAVTDRYDYDPSLRWTQDSFKAVCEMDGTKKFSVRELEKELKYIRYFEKGTIFDILSELDEAKMGYICTTLRSSLYKMRTGVFNHDKLDILLAMRDIEPSALLTDSLISKELVLRDETSPAESDSGIKEGSSESENVKHLGQDPVVVYRDVKYRNPYGLVLSKEMTERLVELSKRTASDEEIASSGKDLETLRKLLQGYSQERFEKILSMANPLDVVTILNELSIGD